MWRKYLVLVAAVGIATWFSACDFSVDKPEDGCTTDSDCEAGVCDDETGTCVACLWDGHCDGHYCLLDQNACVECFEDSHCPDGLCNPQTNSCVGCLDDGDCDSGVCDLAALACVGEECANNGQCNDDNQCTEDGCTDGLCLHVELPDGEPCSDGEYCTTGDHCEAGECVYQEDDPTCVDADADGFNAAEDCDDDDPQVHPGAEEVCDEIDNNCDDQVDEGCEEPGCVDEGGSVPIVPDTPECCEGLSKIPCDAPGDDGLCMACDGASFCTFCGDGECNEPENLCNCADDCDDEPPPPNECEEEAGGACHPMSADKPGAGCPEGTYSVQADGCAEAELCCVDKPGECFGEGEGFTDFDYEDKCCPGLTPVADCMLNPDGSCSCPKCPCYVCTYCGDGECGVGETACTCPEDCGEPEEEECIFDKDCDDFEECTLDFCVDGECEYEELPDCGGDYCWGDDMCQPFGYCQYPDGGCWAETGFCTPIPEACIALYDPVCGCDGVTYGNYCGMQAASQSMAYDGECEVECVGEGDTGSGFVPGPPMVCCPGLVAISLADWDPVNGICSMATDVFICSDCGNGSCETGWENPCNCPADCDAEEECVGEGEMGSGMLPDSPGCCEGLGAISVEEWDPVTGMCMIMMDVFLCSYCGNGVCESGWENPCNCAVDCLNEPMEPTVLCAETGGSWTNCGSGCGPWSCGSPISWICPAVCIPQCACPADAPGWDPVAGCVKCSCDEWYGTYQWALDEVTQCSAASDCVDLPGTSCGCTHNLVVNADADLTYFWMVAEMLGEAGCSPFVSTCDCPPADGFACEAGQCTWNYL